MSKVAYKDINLKHFSTELGLKSTALFFDKIFCNESVVAFCKNFRSPSNEVSENLRRNSSEFDYLLDKGVVGLVASDGTYAYDEGVKTEIEIIIDGSETITQEYFNHFVEDYFLRKNVIALNRIGYENVFPLLSTPRSYTVGNQDGTFVNVKKHQVTSFVLKMLPVPNETCSWEEIIDFRSDDEVQLKYYALVNWINAATVSDKPISDLEDEFKYLYYQYKEQFKLHKMKSSYSPLEIIVSGVLTGIASLSGLSIATGLMKVRLMTASLMQEELKLPGSEIAYIHQAEQKFK